MDKETFVKLMNQYGEAVITYISPISKKEKFNVGTIDMNNSYIQGKLRSVANSVLDPMKVLTFCWDTDSVRQIDPKVVISVEPLQSEIEKAQARKRWQSGKNS